MHMPQDAQCRKGSRAEVFLMHRHRMLNAGATIGGIIFVCFVPLYFIQTSRSDRCQPPLAVVGPLKMASGGGVPVSMYIDTLSTLGPHSSPNPPNTMYS